MKALRNLSVLQEWPSNYRQGDVDAIRRSIRRFGFNGALRVRGEVVYAGNHALKALNAMRGDGEEPPHGVTVKGADWQIPVISIDHLSEEEAIAFAIADNRTQELGDLDHASLYALLHELDQASPSLPYDAGYTQSDMNDLLVELAVLTEQPRTRAAKTDPADELLEKWQCESGQAWIVGNSSILECGPEQSDPYTCAQLLEACKKSGLRVRPRTNMGGMGTDA